MAEDMLMVPAPGALVEPPETSVRCQPAVSTGSTGGAPAPGPGAADLVRTALDFGFSQAARMDVATLEVRDEVRAMCAADRCQSYARSWSCPPACGSLDGHRRTLARFHTGLLVQTTGTLDDPFDYDEMVRLGRLQQERVRGFRDVLRLHYPRLVALGNGACTACDPCTYPSEPCRHPDQLLASMEAFGLVVADVCARNGLGYYYGPGTLTYTGCYLLE